MSTDSAQTWSCFTCSFQFDDQLAFCLHLHEKHLQYRGNSNGDLVGEQDKIFCQMCAGCFMDEREHETRHYSTKIGAGSMIECLRCYKTFKTLDQMKDHNRQVHEAQLAKTPAEQCHICYRFFTNRNLRDQHIIGHLPGVIDRVMDQIDVLQSKMEDRFTSNLCPICGHVVSTRKSLKQHVLFQHIFRSQKDLDTLLGKTNLDGLETELKHCRRMLANPGLLWKRQDKSKQPKKSKIKETKQQEFAECKQEPIDEEILCVFVKKEPQPRG